MLPFIQKKVMAEYFLLVFSFLFNASFEKLVSKRCFPPENIPALWQYSAISTTFSVLKRKTSLILLILRVCQKQAIDQSIKTVIKFSNKI